MICHCLFLNLFLSFRLSVWTSLWSNVWSLKNHCLCPNYKLAVSESPTRVGKELTSVLLSYFLPPTSSSAQYVHWTVVFPFDRARWDLSSNLKPVMLLNIYLSQCTRSKGTLRKVDFREPQTLNLWFSLKYSPVVTTNYAPLFPCNSPLAMGI